MIVDGEIRSSSGCCVSSSSSPLSIISSNREGERTIRSSSRLSSSASCVVQTSGSRLFATGLLLDLRTRRGLELSPDSTCHLRILLARNAPTLSVSPSSTCALFSVNGFSKIVLTAGIQVATTQAFPRSLIPRE